ncbi:hypothetical protein TcWFU_008428 [Taenia crassiceps]|uniref:Uncharacterized protein n=1 Tax=Taenia crassiceps TaxID=6207 RepID=A0ABR4Q8L6_9CEST
MSLVDAPRFCIATHQSPPCRQGRGFVYWLIIAVGVHRPHNQGSFAFDAFPSFRLISAPSLSSRYSAPVSR